MTKQTKDGWIRHRGGKCPVDAGSIIDVRYRKAEPGVAGFSPSGKRADYYYWAHDAGQGDIMAYKLHKPAEQVEPFLEAVHAFNALSKVPQLDGPFGWRDRITEIDATTQALTTERAELVQKLAIEGFALIAAVVAPTEDMSDWRNWRAGDVVSVSRNPDRVSPGNYKVLSIEHHDYDGVFPVKTVSGWPRISSTKFHSRPTN